MNTLRDSKCVKSDWKGNLAQMLTRSQLWRTGKLTTVKWRFALACRKSNNRDQELIDICVNTNVNTQIGSKCVQLGWTGRAKRSALATNTFVVFVLSVSMGVKLCNRMMG